MHRARPLHAQGEVAIAAKWIVCLGLDILRPNRDSHIRLHIQSWDVPYVGTKMVRGLSDLVKAEKTFISVVPRAGALTSNRPILSARLSSKMFLG